MADYFFLVFVLTVVIIRIFLFFYPIPATTIGRFRIHHYMYGIFGILLGLFINSIIIYSIGLGFFVDELAYLVMRGKTHQDNYSKTSLLGTLLFVILVFLMRNYLVRFFA